MVALSARLKRIAKLNFCEDCYSKYLHLIHGEIQYLLSEPISDWRQTEANIDIMWIKAKALYNVVNSTVFSPHENAFRKAKSEKLWKKLRFLKEEGLLHEYTYRYLDEVRKRRNKIHSQSGFSEQDYTLFREARALTGILMIPTIHDLKDERWKNVVVNVENRAKRLLQNVKSP